MPWKASGWFKRIGAAWKMVVFLAGTDSDNFKYSLVINVSKQRSSFDSCKKPNIYLGIYSSRSMQRIDFRPLWGLADKWCIRHLRHFVLPIGLRLFLCAETNTVNKSCRTSFLSLVVPPFIESGLYYVRHVTETVALPAADDFAQPYSISDAEIPLVLQVGEAPELYDKEHNEKEHLGHICQVRQSFNDVCRLERHLKLDQRYFLADVVNVNGPIVHLSNISARFMSINTRFT